MGVGNGVRGVGVGDGVGFGVGAGVGGGVASAGVGDGVGFGVGDGVGKGVTGAGVGDGVGLGVGNGVGFGVGDGVGFGVGDGVGFGDGAGAHVYSQAKPRSIPPQFDNRMPRAPNGLPSSANDTAVSCGFSRLTIAPSFSRQFVKNRCGKGPQSLVESVLELPTGIAVPVTACTTHESALEWSLSNTTSPATSVRPNPTSIVVVPSKLNTCDIKSSSTSTDNRRALTEAPAGADSAAGTPQSSLLSEREALVGLMRHSAFAGTDGAPVSVIV